MSTSSKTGGEVCFAVGSTGRAEVVEHEVHVDVVLGHAIGGCWHDTHSHRYRDKTPRLPLYAFSSGSLAMLAAIRRAPARSGFLAILAGNQPLGQKVDQITVQAADVPIGTPLPEPAAISNASSLTSLTNTSSFWVTSTVRVSMI